MCAQHDINWSRLNLQIKKTNIVKTKQTINKTKTFIQLPDCFMLLQPPKQMVVISSGGAMGSLCFLRRSLAEVKRSLQVLLLLLSEWSRIQLEVVQHEKPPPIDTSTHNTHLLSSGMLWFTHQMASKQQMADSYVNIAKRDVKITPSWM